MKTKKLWSIILSLALLASLIVVPTTASAADVEKSEPIPMTPGSTLTSRKYVVSSDITITGDACQSALVVSDNAQVTITIKEGCTLTVTGGDASGIYGAGAGIEVPEGSSLTIVGTGTLNATGGKAADGEPGQGGDEGLIVVDDPAHDEDDWCYSGKGGDGGAGGGGAGAGIGGRGGNGGAGGKGGAGLSYEANQEAYSGQNGGMGITGNRGSDCGDITVAKTVTLNAVGGGVSGIASAGGGNGFSDTHGWTNWYCAWGGGGGGAGGNGYAGAGIGSGGSGGTGGGGGGSGIIDYWGDRDKVSLCEGTGLGGEGGYGSTDGLKGKDYGPTHDTNHYVFAGDGGRTGVNGFDGMEKQDVTYLQAVAIPSAKELIYNGQEQTGVSAGENYTISGNSGTNAGTYTATATLKDGYCWNDGTLNNKKVEWTIAKQKVAVPEFCCLDYTGRRMTAFKDAELYTVTNGKATEVGTHTAVFTLRDSQNYEWADSKYNGETNYEIHLFTDEDYNGKCDICEEFCEEYNTIYISSAAELLTVWLNERMSIGPDPKRGLFSGKTLKLLSDITCEVIFENFSGTFDGNGHTIEMQELTLFTEINNATIKNLTVSGKTSHGGIVTTATNSNIINCVNRSETQDAGIVCTAYGCTVTGCINYGTIYTHYTKSTVYERAAGIVLGAYGCKISNCINFGTVSAERGTGIRASAGIADIIGSAIEISNCATLGIIESCNYRCGILTLINQGAVFKASNIFVGGYLRDTSGAPHDQNNKEASMCLQSYSENISFNNIFLSENYRNIGDSTPWAILQKATYIDGSDLSKVAETLNVEANKHLDWYKWTVKDGALAFAEPVGIYHAEKKPDCNGGHLSYYEKDGKYYATGEFDSIIEDIDAWLKTTVENGGGYLSPVHIDEDKNGYCDICEADVLATECGVTYLDKIINDDNTVTTKEANLDHARMIGENDATWGNSTVDGTTWYVLDKDVTLQNRPEVKGKVAIVLKNGCTLTANKGITLEEGNSLAIYAQSDEESEMGKLNITAPDGETAIGGRNGENANIEKAADNGGNCGIVVFCGGNVSLTGMGNNCIGGGNGGRGIDFNELPQSYDHEYNKNQRGADGGNGGNIYFCGGIVAFNSSENACIGGGNGGRGASMDGNVVHTRSDVGGKGGNSGNIYFYSGKVMLNSTRNACIVGGNGGNGGSGGNGKSAAPGSDGGNGGNIEKIDFYGGTVDFICGNDNCIRGGNGGAGGKGGHIESELYQEPGANGANGTIQEVCFCGGKEAFTSTNAPCFTADANGAYDYLTISGTPELKAGDNFASAVTTDGYNGQKYLSVIYKKLLPDESGIYHINDETDWVLFDEKVKGGHTFKDETVLLEKDITITNLVGGFNSNPVLNRPFCGIFDGQGHTITVSLSGESDRGVFSHTHEGAVIKNLKVTGTNSGVDSVGGVVGNAYKTTFINCESSVTVTGSNNYTGGIAGWSGHCTFNSCINSGTISGNEKVGGIAGYADYGVSILNSINIGTVSGSKYAGGIVGGTVSDENGNVLVANCINYGKITATNDNAGGIAGNMSYCGTVKNCFTAAEVNGAGNSGIVVGWANRSFSLENCFYQILDANSGMEAVKNMNSTFPTTGVASADNADMITAMNRYVAENAENTADWQYWTVKDNKVWLTDDMSQVENVLSLKLNGNGFIVNAIGKDTDSGTVLVVLYDSEKQEHIFGIKAFDLKDQTPTGEFNKDGYIKAMWWSDLSKMTPFCDAVGKNMEITTN